MKKLFIVFTFLLALLFTACNKEKVESKDNTIIVGENKFSGIFYFGWGQNGSDVSVRDLVYDDGGLLALNESGEIFTNFMTVSRDISDDGFIQIFNLKKGIKFHNGEEFTAFDVKFTYELYMDKEAMINAGGSSSIGEYVESVNIIDSYTVEFVLKENFYTIDTSVFLLKLLNRKYIEKNKPADKTVQQHIRDSLMIKPVGLGAYKLVKFDQRNNYVKLVRYKDYPGNFRGNKPSIENILIKEVSTEEDYDELSSLNIELLDGVTEDFKINSAKASDYLTFNNYPRHGFGHLTFHTDFGPTADVRVRQAIGFMINRKKFIKVFLGKYGKATHGPYSTNYWMIDENWVENNLIKYEPDQKKVESLLHQAGYYRNYKGYFTKDGKILKINIAVPSQKWADSLNTVLTEGIQKRYGIRFTVDYIEFPALLAHVHGSETSGVTIEKRKYHAFALGATLPEQFDGYEDFHSDFIYEYGTGYSLNNSRYNNIKADEYLMAMRTAKNDDIFAENYREWVKIMNIDLPILPLYSNDYYDLYSKKLKNFKTSAMWDWTEAIIEANL